MARRAKLPTFEICEPLKVRLPLPVRWNAGPMEVESVRFDGKTVRVTYRKCEAAPIGWWYGRAIHDIEYLPAVTTIEAALDHAESMRPGYQYRQGRIRRAGAGLAIRLSPMAVAGGTNWIYVVTPRGAMCIPDSTYRLGSLRVLQV